MVSPGSGAPSLVVRKDGTAHMAAADAATDVSNVQTAVSGFGSVLMQGDVLAVHGTEFQAR